MSSIQPSETFAALVEELRRLRQHHGLRDPARLVEAPTLSAVAAAAVGAQEGDLALAAKRLLCQVIAELGGEDTLAASAAYGLGPGNEAPTLTRRRSDLALRFNVTTRTLQRHEERIIDTIAFALLERAQSAFARSGQPWLELSRGQDGRVAVDWLVRFEAYYRIWSDLAGLAHDLEAYYQQRADPPLDRDLTSYFGTSLWYFARFLLHLDRFQYDHGGLWLLPDAEDELAVSNAVYRITWNAPTSDLDDSWLRTVLTLVPGEELGFFLEHVAETDDGRAIVADWSAWVAGCGCTEFDPNKTCEPHQVIGLCRFYVDTIDREWRRVAERYHAGP